MLVCGGHAVNAYQVIRKTGDLDLVVVDDATFDAMMHASRSVTFGGTACAIPSIEHLMAMKLHALRFAGEARMRKDGVDVVELAEANGIDLLGDAFRSLCDRFADGSVYERILLYAGKR